VTKKWSMKKREQNWSKKSTENRSKKQSRIDIKSRRRIALISLAVLI
jgi:hypothetical protein